MAEQKEVRQIYAHRRQSAKVSVIVPMFHASGDLDNLFSDLEKQTFTDFELVMVDDGSKDGSCDKACALARKLESRISGVRILEEPNGGQGHARNTALSCCSGEYDLFLDQDDHILPDYIEQLVNRAEETGADIVISGYREVFRDGRLKNEVKLSNSTWCRFMNITPWGKIYRASFVRAHDARFMPVKLGEDIYFNLTLYSCGARVAYTSYIGYYWVVNDTSLSRTQQRAIHDDTTLFPLLTALAEIRDQHKELWKADPDFEYFVIKLCVYHLLLVTENNSYEEVRSYRDGLFSWLGTNFPSFLHNSLIRPFRPDGEKMNVRLIVWAYMLLYRCHLDGILLRIRCRK